MPFIHEFVFEESTSITITGEIRLRDPDPGEGDVAFRRGRVQLDAGPGIDIVLAHGPATQQFIYLSHRPLTPAFCDLLGLAADSPVRSLTEMALPGQLILGPDRTALVQRGVAEVMASTEIAHAVDGVRGGQVVICPILREGVKYGIAEALLTRHDLLCPEVVVDAHHVLDSTQAVYRRGVEVNRFNDIDFSDEQKEQARVVVIGDSIASGTVLAGVLRRVHESFPNTARVEVIAPFATVRGIARLAYFGRFPFAVRIHIFETPLHVLPPDFYYSPHFSEPGFHFDIGLQRRYEEWWGLDASGSAIADTACAGYGWSEGFFSPHRQIEMINAELGARHGLTIGLIVGRNV